MPRAVIGGLLVASALALPAHATDCEPSAFRAAVGAALADAAAPPPALADWAAAEARAGRACPAPTVAPACLDAATEPALETARAWAALREAAEAAQAFEPLPVTLDQLRATYAYSERATAAGHDVAAPTADAVRAAEERLAARAAAEVAVREAEERWLAAAERLGAVRCASACAVGACATARKDVADVAVLRELHADLAAAEATFLTTWAPEPLRERIDARGAGGSTPGLAVARAAHLRRMLAEGPARPAVARARLAELLADVGGSPSLGPQRRAALRAWVTYERGWRASLERLDGRIDAVIDAWAQLDAATARPALATAQERLHNALRALAATGAAPP
jgi:hypothetical protein